MLKLTMITMTKIILHLLLLPFILLACNSNTINQEASESFSPMQIGNYWKTDAQNFTEIKDTVRIDGKLYYQYYSLTGGDAISETYLRIDENNQLKESWPSGEGKEYTRAQFNANVGDRFFTLNDQSTNDYQVTVIKKTDQEITFSFEMIYQDNMKGEKHEVTYVKGIGLKDNWKSIRIDDQIIQ